ncbi:mitochondrial acidic protein MAM33, putative [Babesia microti strain RI]|uniref:Mitochondrial acidic protein MAM33, putative n=1 Tax=Babesia microti (strain RI) TaxID=1133968 RepID=A0A1N6LXG3_BABMR|nr:mitochondrial acidic protein MAM33, putative [Babesia microti strain RI]SIO73557.1 mitochondrial acidic protein MAM33, putative [Babesia microti strain RI]|eukprot:XP_021337645.1 mitochondrial acidic protein MAM33, putative [Babesia microti strain RI]
MVSYRNIFGVTSRCLTAFKRNIYSISYNPLSYRCPYKSNSHFQHPNSLRNFSTEQQKLLQIIQGEIQHETTNYEEPSNLKSFLSSSGWKLEETEGEVNMSLKKTVNGMNVSVEFQLVSPFEPDGEGETQAEMTEFSVSVEKEGSPGNGLIFFCTTIQNDEKFRYMICNVRQFANNEAKNSIHSYNGPEFEDLDDTLQSALDEWLGSLGIDSELCDFIDSCSIDKEQREYVVWLKGVEKFLS